MKRFRPLRLAGVMLCIAAGFGTLAAFILVRTFQQQGLGGEVLPILSLILLAASILGVAGAALIVWKGNTVLHSILGGMTELRSGRHARLVVPPRDPFSGYLREFNRLAEDIRRENERLSFRSQKREIEKPGISRTATMAERDPSFPEDIIANLNGGNPNGGNLNGKTSGADTAEQAIEPIQSEVVATISHELRTPLTSIKGALSLLRSGGGGHITADARELVDIALSSAERMVTTVNNLLDVGQFERKTAKLSLAASSFQDVVTEAVAAVASDASKRRVEIETSLPVPCPTLNIDSKRIVQVLTNLLSNAIKFSPEGSRVLLSAAVQQDLFVVRVQDFGKGISQEFMGRLFHKFEHEQGALTRETQGCGLGLAICRFIMNAHGGRIWVTSNEGAGSVFFFSLPLARRTSQTASQVVMAVDDDDDLLTALEDFCQENGWRLISCHVPKDALRLARYYSPAMIVVDSMASLEDTWAICQQLADDPATSAIPLICLADPGDVENSGGQEIYCPGKPADSRELRSLLMRVSSSLVVQ